MSAVDDDTPGAVVAFASGAIIGVLATLLFVRVQRNRERCSRERGDDYSYDGGDLFV